MSVDILFMQTYLSMQTYFVTRLGTFECLKISFKYLLFHFGIDIYNYFKLCYLYKI